MSAKPSLLSNLPARAYSRIGFCRSTGPPFCSASVCASMAVTHLETEPTPKMVSGETPVQRLLSATVLCCQMISSPYMSNATAASPTPG